MCPGPGKTTTEVGSRWVVVEDDDFDEGLIGGTRVRGEVTRYMLLALLEKSDPHSIQFGGETYLGVAGGRRGTFEVRSGTRVSGGHQVRV